MNSLVLNRHPLTDRDYPAWIGDGHVVLITDAARVSADPEIRAAQLARYDHVELVEDYDFNVAVERLAVQLHRKFGFDRIIALPEFDILRAARLRALLGIEGQDVRSAVAFRDKVVMKDLLRRAGVPTADYAAVADYTDLCAFIERVGYPVVMKPRRGGGSDGVHVLRTDNDLGAYVAAAPGIGHDDDAHLLAEAYVEHVLHHIDGIFVDGACRLIWPSTHGATGCLDPMKGGALVSALLEPTEPLFAPMVELTRRAIDALPTPPTFLFHAEVFDTAEGLVFNEIGSRLGGAMVEPTLELGFGINLPETYVRALTGNDVPAIPEAPRTLAGWATLPPRAGTLVRLPEDCPVEGVTYRTYAEPGVVLQQARLSPDKIAALLAVGESRAQVQQRLDMAVAWFEDTVEIRPA